LCATDSIHSTAKWVDALAKRWYAIAGGGSCDRRLGKVSFPLGRANRFPDRPPFPLAHGSPRGGRGGRRMERRPAPPPGAPVTGKVDAHLYSRPARQVAPARKNWCNKPA